MKNEGKSKPISVKPEHYNTISAVAQSRGVSLSQVLNEVLDQALGQVPDTGSQSGKKPESNIADQMLGMNLL
ncbi:hypothetical protein [Deinococcus misasensis]|uniref:hypothetical protein n=1 Tax=Deinococcus misasensis TaxID=392413 RepID=UPI0005508F45|nr:hypothetical protein [Deinococcus misasensis]